MDAWIEDTFNPQPGQVFGDILPLWLYVMFGPHRVPKQESASTAAMTNEEKLWVERVKQAEARGVTAYLKEMNIPSSTYYERRNRLIDRGLIPVSTRRKRRSISGKSGEIRTPNPDNSMGNYP
jgi:hypothetical protein